MSNKKLVFVASGCRGTNPLNIKLCKIPFRINKIAINATLIDLVQLSLEIIEICFAQ